MLLGLRRVDFENVVAALDTLVVGEEDDVLGVVVEIRGGLLDNGETLIEGVERLVAKRVGTLDVRRDVLVRLGEVREDGSSEGLVGRVAEGNGALSDAVGLDGGDAIGDQRVVEEVLRGLLAFLSKFKGPASWGGRTWRKAELTKGATSPLTWVVTAIAVGVVWCVRRSWL